MNTSKLAIIISGGGMRSSYSAGAMNALAKEHNITEPFLLICGSGSVGTGAYYLAKQYKAIQDIWTKFVVSKKLLDKRRFWKILDVDYLIDDIIKKKVPLNQKEFYKSKTKYLMALLNKNTGRVDYLDNQSNKSVSIIEKIRAALEMPIAFKLNPGVKIKGITYCDSIASANSYAHIKKAVECGAEKILMIRNVNKLESRGGDIVYWVWMLFQRFRESYYKKEKELLGYKLPRSIRVFKLYPQKNIGLVTLDNNKVRLKKVFKQGYSEVRLDSKLKTFLEEE